MMFLKKFLKITEDHTLKVGNHYDTPLPLRNLVMTLAKNHYG